MKRLLFFLLIGSSTSVYAQRNFTIEETVFGPNKFAPTTLYGLQWTKKNDILTHLDASYQKLIARQAKDNWTEKEIANITDLTNALRHALPQDTFELRIFPFSYDWVDDNTLAFELTTDKGVHLVEYNIANKKATVIKSYPNNIPNIEKQKHYAYSINNNILIVTESGEKIVVTKDTVDGIVNGSDYTHRQEFGIKKGMWWSPDNKKLLYYRKDETMVTKYPLPQWDPRIAMVKNIRYPMAGMKSEEVTLVVYDTQTRQYTPLQTGEPKERYLTIVTWDPSGRYIYVGVLNRGQDHLKLNQYDAQTGTLVKTLFEERSTTWVEPQEPLIFLPNTPDRFLYQTDKDGYNQLYLYDTSGKLIKHLGYNDVIVVDFKGFDSKGRKAYYIGASNKGLERHLFEVDLKSGKTQQLTSTGGVHNATIS